MVGNNCDPSSTNDIPKPFPGRTVDFADVRFPTKPHIAAHNLRRDPALKLNAVDGNDKATTAGGLLLTDHRPKVNVHRPQSSDREYKDEV